MPRQPEGKLVVKMKTILSEAGARSFKIMGSDSSFQEAGIPDLLVCYCGRFLAIEVKQPGGRLRPTQRVVLNETYAARGIAAVVETVEQLRDLLSVIRRMETDEVPNAAICFDRGIFRDHCKFK